MSKIRIKFYRKIPERYKRILLSKFTYPDGALREAYHKNNIVRIAIAKSKYGKILGWCAIYHSKYFNTNMIPFKDYSVGVFVGEESRHHGIGSRLRRKAILWCLQYKETVWWFDAGNDWDPTRATKKDMKYITGKEVQI